MNNLIFFLSCWILIGAAWTYLIFQYMMPKEMVEEVKPKNWMTLTAYIICWPYTGWCFLLDLYYRMKG